MTTHKIGDFLHRHKDTVELQDDAEYSRVTIKLYHKGVCLRDKVLGSDVKASKMFRVRAGQFILSRIDARNGAFGIIPDELDGAVVTNDFLAFDVDERIIRKEFFHLFTRSASFADACVRASTGTTSRIRLDEQKFLDFPIELPPLNEQNDTTTRIQTTLDTVTDVSKEFKHQQTDIKRLQQAILSAAVRGELVPQDPNDEPAEKLLERIKVERDKHSKKQRDLPPVSKDEEPYPLPKGWVWTRLGNVAGLITKGTTPTTHGFDYQLSGINFIKVEDIYNGKIIPSRISKFISNEAHEFFKRSQLIENDILFSIAGSIGTTCVVEKKDLPANTNQALAIIRGYEGVFDVQYLRICLLSSASQNTRERARGGAMNNISLGDIAEMMLPVPPAREQLRIITAVTRMSALCEQLEAELNHNKSKSEALLSAVLREAFEVS
jgi:type I restriction enzyme S subunit